MTEILLGLEEKNVTSIPVGTPTEPDVSRKRSRRQRRRCSTRQSNSAVVEENMLSDNPEDTRRPLVASKRVIFDEDGNHQSTVSMSCDEKNTCNRKTQKRSGFFDMKKLIAVTKDNLRSPKSGESSCTSCVDALNLPHTPEVEVRCVKDQYLETRIYKFPTDYDSIVRYWYLNLDQLARLNQAPDQFLTANSSYGCVNNSPDVSTQDALDNAPAPDHSLDESASKLYQNELSPHPDDGSPPVLT
ncbi:hypothetical protein CRM22_010110 [Opisthorchis felineus]|uniref:Uncharacterized protein n=1 Tax=Opisthorchis felineus TaxID=147828 RepID=A0A4S2L2A3_OPIFE|nr:hypothetical protein CRM22_010110 [Opisthorchis felineus]